MVNIESRLEKIRKMVDAGQYFTINRARQYGKTTILRALARLLKNDYVIICMDFQKDMTDTKFRDENTFAVAFASSFIRKWKEYENCFTESTNAAVNELKEILQGDRDSLELVELFHHMSAICGTSEKPLVLMIDEVDSATNNQVFLDFLAQLRGYYIERDEIPTFHSVILAGMYDVKNIKRKIRPEDERKVNSPWNIAADFLVDMSFSAKDITGMIQEYEADYHTGMDITGIAELLYDYTSGYPFLVSRICKLIDERIAGSDGFPDKGSAWTKSGFLEALKLLLNERNTLFESLTNKLADYPELRKILYELLFAGKTVPYTPFNPVIEMAEMFGFIKNDSGNVALANRIFETLLYNFFLSEELLASKEYDAGRRCFMLFLKPIINGTGNCYVEAQTRNRERMDLVVDYLGEQFIVELKIWHGEAYNTRGEEQLLDYLDYHHLKEGYMLSFCFNQKKQIGVHEVVLGDRLLIEAVV